MVTPSFYYRSLLLVFSLLVFLSGSAGAGWHSVIEAKNTMAINDAVSSDDGIIIAAGNKGKVYALWPGETAWSVLETPVKTDLLTVSIVQRPSGLLIIAAGRNGTVIRSTDSGITWQMHTVRGGPDFRTSVIDGRSGRFWLGGDDGLLYWSENDGMTWQPFPLAQTSVVIADIFTVERSSGEALLYIIANDAAAAHTFFVEENLNVLPAESFPGIVMTAGTYLKPRIYLTGFDSRSSMVTIYRRFLIGDQPGPVQELHIKGSSAPTDIAGALNHRKSQNSLVISTEDGVLFESDDNGLTWEKGYSDPRQNTITNVVIRADQENPSNGLTTYSVTGSGLILENGFDLAGSQPYINEMAKPGLNSIRLEFTEIPEFETLEPGITVRSNYSGSLFFNTAFNPADSKRVELTVNRIQNVPALPGETWNISLDATIRDHSLAANALTPINFNTTFLPYPNPDFNFEIRPESIPRETAGSNFVAGWFNDDDNLDLIHYADDLLWIYTVLADGSIEFVKSEGFPIAVQIVSSIEEQLLAGDFDRDGDRDLILYDDQEVYLILNQSTGLYNFQVAVEPYVSSNIRQVLLLNADHDSHIDMLVLDDSLYTVMDIDNTLTDREQVNYPDLPGLDGYTDMKVGDLDANGTQDVVLLSPFYLTYLKGNGDGSFMPGFVLDQFTGYTGMALTDLDKDRLLEIVAHDAGRIEIFSLDRSDFSTLIKEAISPLMQSGGGTIQSLVVQDFGQRFGSYGEGLPDIFMLTQEGRVKIYENMSYNTRNFGFFEQVEKEIPLNIDANEILPLDLDRDGKLDLFSVDKRRTQFQNVLKKSWAPEIYSAEVTTDGIALRWQSFDETLGDFVGYRIYRTDGGATSEQPVTINVLNQSDTTYLDRNIEKFRQYTYTVQAFYDGGVETDISKPAVVETFILLTNPLPPVISDSTFGYLVREGISVAENDSLRITEGIELIFETNQSFNIYGQFRVEGTESNLVSFSGKSDGTVIDWPGIYFAPGTDTVRLEWLSVTRALTGIRADQRPLHLRFGGMALNAVGMEAAGDTLVLENVSIDSNNVGMNLLNGSAALIKNSNLFHNQTAAIRVGDAASARVKNSILWYNQGTAIQAVDGSNVRISYSTVENWSGTIVEQEVSRLEPRFLAPDSGYYRVDLMSPTVDAGDPDDAYDEEPAPNGGRINQGLYGGTWLASPTYQPRLHPDSVTITMGSKPAQTDSAAIVFHNDGNVDLVLSGYALQGVSGIFNIPEDGTFTIPPQERDSLIVLFTPEKRIQYSDTLLVFSNDPHRPEWPVYLRGTGLNTAPVLTDALPDTAWVNQSFTAAIPVFDEDQDTLRFTALELPEWLALNDDGTLTGIPAIDDTSIVHPLRIRIEDGYGGQLLLSHQLVVSFINEAPVWKGPVYLQYTEDIEPNPFDLNGIVSDENTPFERIGFAVTRVSDSLNIRARIFDEHFLQIELSADYFNTEPALVVLSATDIKGLTSIDTVYVQVNGVEDEPRFIPFPDSTIFTEVLFHYRIRAWDVDGQTLSFSDDSDLFDVHPDSGLIRYTPALQDTGLKVVEISIDDGVQVVQDTFELTVKLNPVKEPYAFSATELDRAVILSFRMPEMQFYTGTRIIYSKDIDELSPEQGVLAIDTVLADVAAGASVSIRVEGLQIGQVYNFSIFNYYYQTGYIFSPPLTGQARTLSPELQVDLSERLFPLAVNREARPEIKVKNDGGGTLIFRFRYEADSLTNIWFHADTTLKTVLPEDSVFVPLHLHPNREMARQDYTALVTIESNDHERGPDSFRVVLRPIFDEFPPDIVILSRPDSLVRESAIMVAFIADDTTGKPIGDNDSDIYKSYRCVNRTTNEIVAAGDSLKSNSILLYPLNDGLYRLQIWGYDTEGNGYVTPQPRDVDFLVQASVVTVPGNRWYMMTVPRPIRYDWKTFLEDSLVKLFRWNNQENRYLPVVFDGVEDHSMGEAFWLFPTQPLRLNARAYPQASNEDSLYTDIETGWNQVGLPVAYNTMWRDMLFHSVTSNQTYTLDDAVKENIISPAVYWYRHNNKLQGYEWGTVDTVIAGPWRGYWFKSNHNGRLIFSRIPALQSQALSVSGDTTQPFLKGMTGWEMDVTLQNELYIDNKNIFGISAKKNASPVYEPPHIGEYCSFHFESEFGPLTRSMLPPFESFDDVRTWDVMVESRSISLEHELSWPAGRIDNNMLYLYLVDPQREEIINMSEQNSYPFKPENGIYNFIIYATQDASFSPKIVPLEFKLAQNYPNPFNPETTIRFGIPESADGRRVTLRVFNVLGQEIATLVDRNLAMGYHEVTWNSTNHSGQLVSSGVYFYNLSTGKETIVRKMILVR